MPRHPVTSTEPGHPGNAGRISPRVQAAHDRHNVLQLLLGGATEQEVAQALGMKPARVKRLIRQILETWRDTDLAAVESVRNLQLTRIDRMVRTLWPRAMGMDPVTGESREPSMKAIAEVRKLETLRARIAGTEAPKRIQVDGSLGFHLEPEEIARAEQAWLGEGAVEGTAAEVP